MKYTRFEVARIVGARALQISMGAPLYIVMNSYPTDALTIAMLEFKKGVVPITTVAGGQ